MSFSQSLASEFQQFLIEDGFLVDTPVAIEKILEKEMGDKRYKKYCRTAGQFHYGEVSIDSLYREGRPHRWAKGR